MLHRVVNNLTKSIRTLCELAKIFLSFNGCKPLAETVIISCKYNELRMIKVSSRLMHGNMSAIGKNGRR